ncbi:MAG: erythronate-4-phosphate dehydrogenase, partial [Alloprevotella sp.]|nr:erythronate-4-phosphate dehydrogenase [Alloprevotella sp.]
LEALARHAGLPASFSVSPPALPPGYRYDPAAQPPCEALRLYDPLADSRRLKADPLAFERMRNAYPLRREP